MSAKKKKAARGGARPGSGRPKVGEGKSFKVFTTLDSDSMHCIKRFAAKESVTVPGAIRILINTGLMNAGLKK